MAMWTLPPQRYTLDDFFEGDTFEVVVSGIFDASKFWIYQRNGPLHDLSKSMMDFFKIQPNFKIPEYLLHCGLFCVVYYKDMFRRVKIVDLLPYHPGLTKVFFIDYGDVDTVKSCSIYYLPQIFAMTPYQVIRARLARVFPPEKGMAWSIKSTKRLCSLVKDRILLAKICSIDETNQALEIELTEKIMPTRRCINNILIDEGLALCQCQQRYDNSLKLNTPDDFHVTYPNFWDLEAGLMLPFHEVDFIIDFIASNSAFSRMEIEDKQEIEFKPRKPRRNLSKSYRVSGAFVKQLLHHDESCYNFVK